MNSVINDTIEPLNPCRNLLIMKVWLDKQDTKKNEIKYMKSMYYLIQNQQNRIEELEKKIKS